jgi:hypothetical protein
VERLRQPVQDINRWVLFAPFEAANVRPINFSIERKPLLREAT